MLSKLFLTPTHPHKARKNETGATYTAFGRYNTLIGELGDADTWYSDANKLMALGHYYRVSNDVLAARNAALMGKRGRVALWLGRGARDLALAPLHGRANTRASTLTFAGRLPDTLSEQRARASLRRTTPLRGGQIVNI